MQKNLQWLCERKRSKWKATLGSKRHNGICSTTQWKRRECLFTRSDRGIIIWVVVNLEGIRVESNFKNQQATWKRNIRIKEISW